MKTYRDYVEGAVRLLEEHKFENARGEVMEFLEAASGLTIAKYLVSSRDEMPKEQAQAFLMAVERRIKHEPMQYILGYSYFYGRKFTVTCDVLIPRFDTECVVEYALKRLPDSANVLDMCTGSGCIGITIALEKKCLLVTAADVSNRALEIAKKNAANLQADVKFIQSDLFIGLEKGVLYDMIISNPPYIPTAVIDTLTDDVKCHEPRLALDGRTDGLFFYDRIIREGKSFLKDGGRFVFEIGCEQAEHVMKMLSESGFECVECKSDLSGLDRIVSGIKA